MKWPFHRLKFNGVKFVIFFSLFVFGLHGYGSETRSLLIHSSDGSSDGKDLIAGVRIPDKLRPHQKIPVFLIFGGFESAGHVLDLIHPDRPVALASFDYPFSAPRTLRLKDGLNILPEAKQLFPRTVQGITGLVRALKAVPEIDPHQIIAIGASFGAPFVLAAAAQDPDISGIVLVHGFGQVSETAEHVILRSWLPKYGWISRPFAWLLSRCGWLYLGLETPESNAQKLGPEQRVLMITAKDDSFIPRASSDSLWLAIERSQAKSSRIVMPGDHLMPGSDRLIDQIVHRVQDWTEWKE